MNDFEESLFGCFNGLKSCAVVLFVPCGAAWIQGWAVAASNPMEPQFFRPCMWNLYLCCLGATINRTVIRRNLGYVESHMLDFVVHLFCMPCGICQEYRETTKEVMKKVKSGIAGVREMPNEETLLNQ